jgi:hypothetical protein
MICYGQWVWEGTLAYDCPFFTGLTVVSVGTWDYTLSYE